MYHPLLLAATCSLATVAIHSVAHAQSPLRAKITERRMATAKHSYLRRKLPGHDPLHEPEGTVPIFTRVFMYVPR